MLRLVVLVASALLVAGVEAQTATTGETLSAKAEAVANTTVTNSTETVRVESGTGLFVNVTASASVTKKEPKKKKEPVEVAPPSAANITATLRDAIARRDVLGIAKSLDAFDDVEALASAFVVNDTERKTLLRKTPNRIDADVVTIKGVAKASLQYDSPIKLAEVILRSLEPSDGIYPKGHSRELTKLRLIQAFSDKKLMRRVLKSDPAKTVFIVPIAGDKRFAGELSGGAEIYTFTMMTNTCRGSVLSPTHQLLLNKTKNAS